MWWQILAALGPLAVLVAALIAWLTLRQRSKSDTLALRSDPDAVDAGDGREATMD